MGGAHRNVHEVALGERDRAVINVEDGIALQHVEPLIRFLMDMRPRPTADRDIHGQERVAAGCLDRRGEETESTGEEQTLRRRCSAYDEHVSIRTFRQIRTRRWRHLAWFVGRIAPRSIHVPLPLGPMPTGDRARGRAVRQCFGKLILEHLDVGDRIASSVARRWNRRRKNAVFS
jgi:hypothetical protein